MAQCQQCNAGLPDGAKFCGRCGAPVPAGQADPAAATAAYPPPPSPPFGHASDPTKGAGGEQDAISPPTPPGGQAWGGEATQQWGTPVQRDPEPARSLWESPAQRDPEPAQPAQPQWGAAQQRDPEPAQPQPAQPQWASPAQPRDPEPAQPQWGAAQRDPQPAQPQWGSPAQQRPAEQPQQQWGPAQWGAPAQGGYQQPAYPAAGQGYQQPAQAYPGMGHAQAVRPSANFSPAAVTAGILAIVAALGIAGACFLPVTTNPAGFGGGGGSITLFKELSNGSAWWYLVEPFGIAVLGLIAALVVMVSRARVLPAVTAGVLLGFGVQTAFLFLGYWRGFGNGQQAGSAGLAGLLAGVLLAVAGVVAGAAARRN